jgi:hypothetical protein
MLTSHCSAGGASSNMPGISQPNLVCYLSAGIILCSSSWMCSRKVCSTISHNRNATVSQTYCHQLLLQMPTLLAFTLSPTALAYYTFSNIQPKRLSSQPGASRGPPTAGCATSLTNPQILLLSKPQTLPTNSLLCLWIRCIPIGSRPPKARQTSLIA